MPAAAAALVDDDDDDADAIGDDDLDPMMADASDGGPSNAADAAFIKTDVDSSSSSLLPLNQTSSGDHPSLWPSGTPSGATTTTAITALVPSPPVARREPSAKYLKEKMACLKQFHGWTEQDQVDFVEELLKSMCHYQHGTVNAFLKPMLQRDFISLLPTSGGGAEQILSYLDAQSLRAAELVSRSWLRVISESMMWKKLIERKVSPF